MDLSIEAKEDLRKIYSYIAFKLMAPASASNQIKRIKKNVLGLDFMPTMFKIYEKEPWHSRGMRIMPVDNYVVFYFIDEENKKVNIARIIYGAMDLDKQISEL
ncbi:MAG: type II toxin-antitoxin system RelE/ParE family toxin [Phascolarctobacterium sp.]|nr:type II toxin-antitoxin system RelE/ParE family toxin [Phascolarctobacterium sp.]